MVDKTIPELTAGDEPDGTELVHAYQGTNSRKLTVAQAARSPQAFATVNVVDSGGSVYTADLGAGASANITLTDTDTVGAITSFGTATVGTFRRVRVGAAVTLTHNATTLILPGLEDIDAYSGDSFDAVSLGSGNWLVTSYTPSGLPYYRSSEQEISSGTTLTLPHGLQGEPVMIEAFLICLVAENGYSAGDRVRVPAAIYTSISQYYGAVIKADDTNIYVRFSGNSSVGNFYLPNFSTGTAANLTNANWAFEVIALAAPLLR